MSNPRWRAPSEDGAVLCVPEYHQLPNLVAQNQQAISDINVSIGGRPYHEARQLAWESLQQTTTQWAEWAGVAQTPLRRPLLMTGHQPELYHPGVWAKNVGIHQLTHQLGGSGLNLNVDSDVAKTTILKIPMNQGEKHDQHLAYGPPHPPLPYEDWQCHDETSFAQVSEHFADASKEWPWKPVFPEFWKSVLQQTKRTSNIPSRWLLARHQWERQHDIANHEFLMSQWCTTSFFRWLLSVFIADAVHFASVYNQELERYRKEHRIRSANHPVANLKHSDSLIELPFWVWQTGTHQRSRLCIKKQNGTLELIALQGTQETLISNLNSALSTEHLALSLPWKFRPKALITSMMFRLFVADLFVHGIGGAVYDELTDRIFQRFWKVKLPSFAVMTATLRLPWGYAPLREPQIREVKHDLRTLHWNPERWLKTPYTQEEQALIQQKMRLLLQPTTPQKLKARHDQLQNIRETLHHSVEPLEQKKYQQLDQLQHQLKHDDHLFSREHPWVFYPQELLLQLRNRFA